MIEGREKRGSKSRKGNKLKKGKRKRRKERCDLGYLKSGRKTNVKTWKKTIKGKGKRERKR